MEHTCICKIPPPPQKNTNTGAIIIYDVYQKEKGKWEEERGRLLNYLSFVKGEPTKIVQYKNESQGHCIRSTLYDILYKY